VGDAMRTGRGNCDEDSGGGRLLMEKAFCMGDAAAKGSFDRSKKHKAPTC
jgi:hypothetical protein